MNSLADVVLAVLLVLVATCVALVLCAGLARLFARLLERTEGRPARRDWIHTGYGGYVEGVDLATQARIHKMLEEEQRERRWEANDHA